MKSTRRIASIFAVCAGFAGFAGPALAAGLDELPADIQSSLYNKDKIDAQQPTGPSAYRDWQAEERAAVDDRLRQFICRQHMARQRA